jgi:hypothetical protein
MFFFAFIQGPALIMEQGVPGEVAGFLGPVIGAVAASAWKVEPKQA